MISHAHSITYVIINRDSYVHRPLSPNAPAIASFPAQSNYPNHSEADAAPISMSEPDLSRHRFDLTPE